MLHLQICSGLHLSKKPLPQQWKFKREQWEQGSIFFPSREILTGSKYSANPCISEGRTKKSRNSWSWPAYIASKFHWQHFSDHFKQKPALGSICNKLKRREGAAIVTWVQNSTELLFLHCALLNHVWDLTLTVHQIPGFRLTFMKAFYWLDLNILKQNVSGNLYKPYWCTAWENYSIIYPVSRWTQARFRTGAIFQILNSTHNCHRKISHTP